MSNEEKAVALLAEAEKKVKSSQGFFGGLFGGASKLEDAVELYIRAANMFKLAKNWSAAGTAFVEAAKIQQFNLQSKHEAAQHYVDAGTCFKKSDNEESVQCFESAIDIFTDMGRFTMAAKNHITIAEIYENNLVDLEKAIYHYEQAADYYRGEESNSSANKCSLKVAMYSAQMENYPKAIEIYEQVAATAIESSILKYSAKEYFFKAALCHMCVDVLEAQRALDKYCDMHAAFQDSRECKLLKNLLEAQEEQNVEAFTEAVQEYDSISRLDQWLTTILLRIKKSMNEEPDLT
ncbi:alpha-soluble NSF attachment protein [Exaiptasia diaphana]|uniref:Alpha-soluble NSF attachment protein n=1 Tax=Exaiptasia diaphana TaxID=2652724 RepID=A0A913Y4U7_EXADI|nr:alpha-soluble NSF attachment protein [Exaiptasia diaphana]KXJ22338.1 Beta-soluble NSF attachment protein [Exaiptasia diaphana]